MKRDDETHMEYLCRTGMGGKYLPLEAHLYAWLTLESRWPEAEPIIQQDALWAHHYALYAIKGRWPEAEPFIQQNAKYAHLYAIDIIRGRWPEAEENIAENDEVRELYISAFFDEPVYTKDILTEDEWAESGATGYFAPASLLKSKTGLLDTMLE